MIVEPGRDGRWLPQPLLRGRTRQEVMQAVLRLDPQLRERAGHAMRLRPSAAEPELPAPLEAQIFPTDLSLNVIYLPAASNRLPMSPPVIAGILPACPTVHVIDLGKPDRVRPVASRIKTLVPIASSAENWLCTSL